MEPSLIISVAIFAVTFLFILTERIHRTVIGLAGAIMMIAVGTLMDFYTLEDAIESVDFNTIGLLFGMMIMIVILEKTGVFQYLGIYTAKKSKGSPWLLLLALTGLTSVLSMVLDNVTTIILIAPITIVVARTLGINPTPFLLAEAILSNVGGTATLVGDPPNIIIGSAAGFSFNDFLVHSLPVVVLVWIATIFLFKFFFRNELAQKTHSLDELMKMDEREAITDRPTLIKMLCILGLVVALFFVHGLLHLEPSVIALMGAALALLLVQAKTDPQPILERTELSVLLFFLSLFILVGGLEHTGVLSSLSELLLSNATDNLLLTAIILLWGAAFLSAVVDNIPFTVAMIPIVSHLAVTSGMDVDILWWALVLGVGFGGNGSPIGSTAGVIVMSKSEETKDPITFTSWLKKGVPVTVAALIIATLALIGFEYVGIV